MKNVNKAIIEALKKEFEYREEDYDQWVMGVSIRQEEVGSQKFTVRVVVKTNESIYIDGMELEVTILDGEAQLEEFFYEKTPDLMGSPGVEASPGEYELKVIVDDKDYYLNCRSSDTREIVIVDIKNEIIIPVMENIEVDESYNYEKYRQVVNHTSSELI